MKILLTQDELATVLAALRYWQRVGLAGNVCPLEWDIANNDGTTEPLNEKAIDSLCERLNVADELDSRP